MDLLSPSVLLLLLISPAIGSFLGVMADRLPRGHSIVQPRSACRSCGTVLGLRDLIPVLSFVLMRGRCRHCDARIPAWVLYLELAAIGVAVWAVILAQTPVQAWLIALFFWLLLTLITTDLTRFRLPDLLTGGLVLVALCLAWVTDQPGLGPALWGAAIGVGSFLALRWGYFLWRGQEGLGLGDVKLMAGLGAAVGPLDLPLMLLIAALGGLITAALTGRLMAQHPLPFGAALAAAGGLVWMARHLPM